MALLDKVPGDLKLYIGGYVEYTFLPDLTVSPVRPARLSAIPITATDMSGIGCSPCAGAMHFNKLI